MMPKEHNNGIDCYLILGVKRLSELLTLSLFENSDHFKIWLNISTKGIQ